MEAKQLGKTTTNNKLIYNNTKNISMSYISFELNYRYYPIVLFEDKTNFYLKSCFTHKLVKELRKLIKICCQNLFHIQELQKRAYNKKIKSFSYTLSKKI